MNLIDMHGQKCGRLTPLDYVGGGKWLCLCICGNEATVHGVALRSGRTQSCGCFHKERSSQASLIDISGMRFGRLTVLCRAGTAKGWQPTWLCRCDCGQEVVVLGVNLRFDRTKSCGCFQQQQRRMRAKDVSGQVFGKLRAVRRAKNPMGNMRTRWLCQCSCGKTTIVTQKHLANGNTKSCGCLQERKGSENPNYDHEMPDENRIDRRLIQGYNEWTRKVYARDDYTCQICNHRGGNLASHHLDAYHWAKDKRILLSNGVTMCKGCHKAFHHVYGTHNNKRSQFIFFKATHKMKVATVSA